MKAIGIKKSLVNKVFDQKLKILGMFGGGGGGHSSGGSSGGSHSNGGSDDGFVGY